MLVYIWCWTVYFICKLTLASDVDVNINNQSGTDSESIFSDVIRNISRVNGVLQELISNYEHLQELYKSQEEIGSDVNRDDDLKTAHIKSNDNERIIRTSTDRSNRHIPGATEMIWSDANNDHSNSNDDDNYRDPSGSSESRPIKKSTQKPPETERWKFDAQDDGSSDEEGKQYKESSDSNEMPIKAESSQEAKIISVDTHKKKRVHTFGSSPTVILEPQFADDPTKIKTRYVVKGHSYPDQYRDNAMDHNTFLRAGKDSKLNVKNIVYAEKFSSKNIWDEVINKPILLKEEKAYHDDMHRISNASELNLRSNALVIVTNNKEKKHRNESSSDLSADDDDAINKDTFKTNILRQAYGDSCWKLVVRKCFLACKSVVKKSCSRFKCKRSFKDTFKKNSKTGCIKYFGNGNNSKTVNYRRDPDVEGEDFVDVTRGGFQVAACWPYASDQSVARHRDPAHPDKKLNILRDKYERACQRASSESCINACTYTYTTSCTGQDCSAGMKRAFKSDCKSQCQNAYGGQDEDSSESSEESSSNSDSF